MAVTPNYDLDIDSTLGGDNASDYVIPSQKAIKSYIDNSTGSTVDQVYDPTSQAAQSGIAIAGANFLTSSDLADYVTINTDQDITGVKTYVGQKRIGFKQSGSSDKLGFTLYNNNNVEKGYLEFNPTNTIDGAPLMTLGNYATAAAGITHVGFRKYSNVSGASGAYNLLAPLISNARTPFNLTTTYTNFYLPLGFTDGTTMVTTANTGVVDLSSILPDISGKQDSSTAVTHTASTAVGSSTTPVYVASDGKATALSYTIEKSVPSNAVFTDTTYSTFTGADSVTAGVSGLVPAPSAGDDDKILTGGATWSALKTINNTSLLGSGNIDTTEVFVATYGTTTSSQIRTAMDNGKILACKRIITSQGDDHEEQYYYSYIGEDYSIDNQHVSYVFSGINQNKVETVYIINYLDTWHSVTINFADNTLSNVSTIDGGSAVQTALNDKVNKSGDTMTGNLSIQTTSNLGVYLSHSDVTKGTNPSTTKYWQVLANDSSNSSTWQSTRLGFLEWSLDSSGTTYMNLAAIENTADSTSRAQLTLSRTQAGVSSATINCALTVQSSLTVQSTINTTGNITITKNGTSQFYAKNSGFNYTSTASTATTVGQFYALDTNGKLCGGLSVQHTDANNATTTIVARRSVSGTEKSAYLTVGVDSSGNAYATAPATPADNNNSTQIATTAFIKKATDGQWIDSKQTILDGDSITHSSGTDLPKTVTLPNDGYKYEVTLRGSVTTGDTSGNYVMLTITGNEDSYGSYVCGCRTRTNSTMFARGQVTVTMSYGSSNLTIARNSAFSGTASLDVIRYRRIGKNS